MIQGTGEYRTEPLDGLRRYRVTGPHVVQRTRPGDMFSTVLELDHEAFLLAAGYIELVEAAPGDQQTGGR